MKGLIDQEHSPPGHNKRTRREDPRVGYRPPVVPISPLSPLPNEERKDKDVDNDALQSMSDCAGWSPPLVSVVDDFVAAAPHLQENLSRQRVGNCTGAGDTFDTCATLRFLYNSPFTRHARQAVQTEQDNNNNSDNLKLDDDDTTIYPGNIPMIGSILEYRKSNVARKPQQEFIIVCSFCFCFDTSSSPIATMMRVLSTDC
jgi:hypothetical protein